jgi:hypothetical protein
VTSRHWTLLSAVVVFFVTIGATSYMVADRVPIGWDEAFYVNRALLDQAALRRGPKPFIGRLLKEDVARPPAYRILHVPFTLALGVSVPSLRLVSFACLLLTLGLVYLAVSDVAGTSAGLFSIIFILPLPSVLGPALWYSTEHPLYIAVAGSLWLLVRVLGRGAGEHEYLLLGGFLGLGLLAKFTFVVMMVPMASVMMLGCIAGSIDGRRRAHLIKGSIVALLIALPWYAYNVKPAFQFATYSSNYARLGLPYSSPTSRTLAYVALMVESGFGYSLAALAALTIGLAVRRRGWRRPEWNRGHAVALLACTATALSVVGMQLFTKMQSPRHTAPGLILIGATLAVVAGRSALVTRRRFFLVSFCLVLSQVGLMLTHWHYDAFFGGGPGFTSQPPSSLFTRERGWDWQTLRTLCLDRLGEKPDLKIGYLGNGPYFNAPEIEHAWVLQLHSWPLQHMVEVTWLWRYEDGPLDWQKLIRSLDQYDVLLTAPNYRGVPSDREYLDAVHNSDFVTRLSVDPRFTSPVLIRPVEDGPDVYVYFQKNVVKQASAWRRSTQSPD